MKKLSAFILSLLMTACIFSACGEKDELQTLRLNEVTHSVFYAPLYAAMDQGFFEEEGIEIELTNGGGADKVMTAVLSGQADIGLAGPEAVIYVMNEGRKDPPVIFAQLTKRDGSFLMGREKKPFSWDDLRGKKIIGGRKGGVPEMTLEYVMKKNGVDPSSDAFIDTSVQFNMMAGAFTGGNGDYVTLFEPAATEMEMAGKGFILASLGEESGEIPYTAFFASESYINDNKELIQSFTNAVAKGQKWIFSHTPAEIAEALSSQFPDAHTEVIEKVAARYMEADVWNKTPIMKEEALERLQDVMTEAGELSQYVPFKNLVNNSLWEKADK